MSNSIFERLQQDFIKIRHIFSKNCYNEVLLNETIGDIKKIRAKIAKKTKVEDKYLILYCIDTLLEIINENNEKKIFDFADTVHNMPEICLGKRNIYSFNQEIQSFQKRYGKEYFSGFKKVKPKFQRKAPKNKWKYFSAASDVSFKYLHPIGYRILCGIGIVALLLPMVIYLVYTLAIKPAPNEWTLLLGQAGAFIIGIGLFNIVAAWIHQYLGHLLTFICIFGGGMLTAISLFLLYN